MSQFFASGAQSIGVSASPSVIPIDSGLISFRMDRLDLLAVQGSLQECSPTPQFKSINTSALSLFYSSTLASIHDYWKNHSFDWWTFVSRVMSLLFNMLSRLVIVFLIRSKNILISRMQSLSMAAHSSTLAWKIPQTEEPGRLQSMWSRRVGHDWETSIWLFPFLHWRRKWQPTPVFLPGESQGWGSLVGCRLWGRTESDMTEVT